MHLQRSVTFTRFAESGGVTESGGLTVQSSSPTTWHLAVGDAIISNHKLLLLLNYEGSSVSLRIFCPPLLCYHCIYCD